MPSRRHPSGSTLVASLLLATFFLVLGMFVLGIRAHQYGDGRQALYRKQAAFLAEAGVWEARARLATDKGFPPVLGDRQRFSWADRVYNPRTHEFVGEYRVEMDLSRRRPPPPTSRTTVSTYDYPNFTVVVVSTGLVRELPGFDWPASGTPERGFRDSRSVRARHVITAEIDLSPKERYRSPVSGRLLEDAPAAMGRFITNPNYLQFLRWEDSESL